MIPGFARLGFVAGSFESYLSCKGVVLRRKGTPVARLGRKAQSPTRTVTLPAVEEARANPQEGLL